MTIGWVACLIYNGTHEIFVEQVLIRCQCYCFWNCLFSFSLQTWLTNLLLKKNWGNYQNLTLYWSESGFKGNVVNRTSFNGYVGSLVISTTIPLNIRKETVYYPSIQGYIRNTLIVYWETLTLILRWGERRGGWRKGEGVLKGEKEGSDHILFDNGTTDVDCILLCWLIF